MTVPEDLTTEAASLVVALVDPLIAGGQPIGALGVRLRGRREQPVRNRSGYHVFTDLPPGNYRVEIDPSQTDAYLGEVMPAPPALPVAVVDPPGRYPRGAPLVTVRLRPRVTYPFAATASLARGMVRKGVVPLAGTTVSVTVADPTRLDPLWAAYDTAAGGGFVFAFTFKQPKSPPQAVTLRATHPVEGASPPFAAQIVQDGVISVDIVYP